MKASRRQSIEETLAAKGLTAGRDGNASPLHPLLLLQAAGKTGELERLVEQLAVIQAPAASP